MRRSSMSIRMVSLLVVMTLGLVTSAALAGEGQVLGKGVGATELVKISELLAKPDTYVGKTVRVEGLITDVCPKRGCWMNLAGDKEFQSLRIKVDDGVIVFPMDAKGKRATAEGVFTKIELTRDEAIAQAKHHAEEVGKPFDESKAGEIPTVIYQLKGTGAVIR